MLESALVLVAGLLFFLAKIALVLIAALKGKYRRIHIKTRGLQVELEK